MNETPKFNNRLIFGGQSFDSRETQAILDVESQMSAKNLDFEFLTLYQKHPGFSREELILRFVIGEAFHIENSISRMEKHQSYLTELKKRGLSNQVIEYFVS